MDSVRFAKGIENNLIALRRGIHRHPESGWTEYRTASVVMTELQRLGFDVKLGSDVILPEERMGLPGLDADEQAQTLAVRYGAKADQVAAMAGGMTGVAGIMRFSADGPTVAFRFDMDCNDVSEAADQSHEPKLMGFSSMRCGAMHACGHDGHTAMGLGLARYLAQEKERFHGTVKLLFQPAEEGCRGGRAMAASGIVDDVDYLFGLHVGIKNNRTGLFACSCQGFMATTKLDAVYEGRASHAGAAPEEGRNALLAACTAMINLQAISRHSGGTSMVNVGMLQGGTARNVIPDRAVLQLETRGATTEINEYVSARARQILQGAAAMQDVDVNITDAGGAPAMINDDAVAREIYQAVTPLHIFDDVVLQGPAGGSEDCSWLMERVRSHGGKACYMGLGMNLKAPHHNPAFDMDERVLAKGVAALGAVADHFCIE